LIEVLRSNPERWWVNAGDGNLSHLADVPKKFVKKLLKGHPNVSGKKVGGKWFF
jgi:hypothetical protein